MGYLLYLPCGARNPLLPLFLPYVCCYTGSATPDTPCPRPPPSLAVGEPIISSCQISGPRFLGLILPFLLWVSSWLRLMAAAIVAKKSAAGVTSAVLKADMILSDIPITEELTTPPLGLTGWAIDLLGARRPCKKQDSGGCCHPKQRRQKIANPKPDPSTQ